MLSIVYSNHRRPQIPQGDHQIPFVCMAILSLMKCQPQFFGVSIQPAVHDAHGFSRFRWKKEKGGASLMKLAVLCSSGENSLGLLSLASMFELQDGFPEFFQAEPEG